MDVASMADNSITYHGWRAKDIRQSQIDFIMAEKGSIDNGEVEVNNITSDHHPINAYVNLKKPEVSQKYQSVNRDNVRYWGKIKTRNHEGKTLNELAEEIVEAPEWSKHLEDYNIEDMDSLTKNFIKTSHEITQRLGFESTKISPDGTTKVNNNRKRTVYGIDVELEEELEEVRKKSFV
eukprot:Lithocolla_globosa_v1_NODE_1574_length_2483_cov_6.390083.p3 type:complete len:179 gc:universal NODE_1574_length_2483_cov_6.390083:707-171(-)